MRLLSCLLMLPLLMLPLFAQKEMPAPAPAPPVAAEEEDPVIPRQPPPARYAATWEKNPFEVKTVAVTQQKASFAEDWALAGISTIGQPSVLLINKKTKEYKRVGAEPDMSGLRLVEALPNPDSRLASATIAVGDEKAKVGYDAALSVAAGNPAGARRKQPSPGSPLTPLPAAAGGQAQPSPMPMPAASPSAPANAPLGKPREKAPPASASPLPAPANPGLSPAVPPSPEGRRMIMQPGGP